MSKGSARRPGNKGQFDRNYDKIFSQKPTIATAAGLSREEWIARAVKAGASDNYAIGLYSIYGIDDASELTPEQVVAIDTERLSKPIQGLEDMIKNDALLMQPTVTVKYSIPRAEWIQRMLALGVVSEDYADSLYLAYTDTEGYSELTPEQVLAEDKQYKPQLYPDQTTEAIMQHDTLLIQPGLNDAVIESTVPQQYRLARKPGGGDLVLQGLFGWQSSSQRGSEWRDIPTVYLTDMGYDVGTQESDQTVIQRITPNGEITFDPETRLYTVWDETYADTVCTTHYPKVAEAALEAYAKHHLDSSDQNPQEGC